MIDLTEEQIERYSRHILLQDVGLEGQGKLLNAKVLIIGAGGLGFTAYNSGLVRRNNEVFYSAVLLILALVFIIQLIGDKASKAIDKR